MKHTLNNGFEVQTTQPLQSLLPSRLFVAGTDTGIGKTFISCKILEYLNQIACKTVGLKPIASGCKLTDGSYYNQDALKLQAAASVKLDYKIVNPFAFEPAIAPHIAAQQSGKSMTSSAVIEKLSIAFQQTADFYLIEGAGGWLLPLNNKETLADVVRILQLPVLLVVGIRLGCLNHALLTVDNIKRTGIKLTGWIANCIDPDMQFIEENIEMLKNRIDAPLLHL